ncbi:MAG: ribonuclease III [Alphaproteobacteria bacterium]|nr:ribonuclease III [Alphaproteobacteria bacterium]
MAKVSQKKLENLSSLEKQLGYSFSNSELITQALIHSSTVERGGNLESNERLEFLGDRVLGLVVSEMLYQSFPQEEEGDLAKRHVGLVRKETLAEIANKIGLGKYMVIAKSEEEMGGRKNPSLLSDCCEAIIAALYLDGGLSVADKFIRDHWTPLMDNTFEPPKDNKTNLQEWAQAHGLGLPNYSEVSRQGPSHAPEFTLKASLQNNQSAFGIGKSKRAAEQAAAGALLIKLEGGE